MIYTHENVRRDLTLEADVCVIGSGAGGGPVALEAARAGRRVVVVEAGHYWLPRDFTQLEHEMFPRLYHDKGGRATADKAIQVHQGKAVGGSTVHNLNLCARLPDVLFEQWRAEYGLAALDPATLDSLYTEIEAHISVTTLNEVHLRGSSLVLKRGCDALGWRGGFLRHNRVGCQESGFCELGCPFDAKQNALKVFIAPAVQAGAMILSDTWAVRLLRQGRRVTHVEAVTRHPMTGAVEHTVRIAARKVCLSASATGTPALIQRSDLPDPHGLVGSRLHLHPGVAVAGIFRERLNAWAGIPQSYECTEWLDFGPGSRRRAWIIPAFAHPAGVSSMLSGFAAEHRRFMDHYPSMAALSPMVHDETSGRVEPDGDFGVSLDYWPNEADQEQVRQGILACARILLAAGAERVVVPTAEPIVLDAGSLESALTGLEIRRHDLVVTSVHPMSSVWMGDDPARSCVDSNGRYHHLDNVWVADTSVFPTSIGVPPQLTTFAMGAHVGRRLLAD